MREHEQMWYSGGSGYGRGENNFDRTTMAKNGERRDEESIYWNGEEL